MWGGCALFSPVLKTRASAHGWLAGMRAARFAEENCFAAFSGWLGRLGRRCLLYAADDINRRCRRRFWRNQGLRRGGYFNRRFSQTIYLIRRDGRRCLG